MSRRALMFLMALLAILASPFSLAIAEQLTIEPACSGHGIRGTLRGENSEVFFTACVFENERVVTVSSALEEMLSMRASRDKEVELVLAGVDPALPLGAESMERIDRMIRSQAAALARKLIPALVGAGLPRDRDEVTLLAVALMGLEFSDPQPSEIPSDAGDDCSECSQSPGACDCSSLRCDCYGCCGAGCAGCTGVCSTRCWEHDRCVRSKGHMGCLGSLLPAMWSAFSCEMTDCNLEECYECWQ